MSYRQAVKNATLILGAALLVLTSCAPKYSGGSSKPDAELTCAEIKTELAKAQSVKAEAQGNKGLSGQNVAWALFFWPGILINESNNNDVIRRVDDRISKLNELYDYKKCTAAEATAQTAEEGK